MTIFYKKLVLTTKLNENGIPYLDAEDKAMIESAITGKIVRPVK